MERCGTGRGCQQTHAKAAVTEASPQADRVDIDTVTSTSKYVSPGAFWDAVNMESLVYSKVSSGAGSDSGTTAEVSFLSEIDDEAITWKCHTAKEGHAQC